MMSGPPLERFENSSHLDEFGPSRGRTGEEARSILGGLSFAHYQQNHIDFSNFFPGTGQNFARTGKMGPYPVAQSSTRSGSMVRPGTGLQPEPKMMFIHPTIQNSPSVATTKTGVDKSKRE